MNTPGRESRDICRRLGRRLQQRYVRWLARQPVENMCLSKGWRAFWRCYRRRANAFLGSRPVVVLTYCVAIGGILFFLGAAVTIVACAIRYLPELFFAPPQHQAFAGPAQRAAVALTRLTCFESMMLPLLLLWASRCFCCPSALETRSLYKKYPSTTLVAYRVVFVCFLACSAAVSVGATIGHEANGVEVAASLAVTGCLGWLAWVGAKRLMAVRWPSRQSPADPWPVALAFLLMLLPIAMLPAVHVLYGSAVLVVSEHLKWLGPFGWVNSLLLGLGRGQTQNLLPLAICCTVALYSGCRLDRPTASWAFRRRLLSIYRTRETSRHATINTTGSTTRTARIAHDLRQAITRKGSRSWKSVLWPRWLNGHGTSMLLLCGLVFLMQLILAGLVLFVGRVEAESGQPLNEKPMLCALLSSVGGWNVLLMEGFAACFRDQAGLVEFSRRPVSPGQVWRQLQLDGLSFAPTQVLFAVPFVTLTAVVAPGYAMTSCLAASVALLACVAIRTAFTAGSCYLASITSFRSWIAYILSVLGMIAGGVLIVGTVGSGLATCVNLELTSAERAIILLSQQIVTLTALGGSWRLWCTVGRSGKGGALPL